MLDRNLKRWELALMFGLLCGLLGGFWLDREQTQLARPGDPLSCDRQLRTARRTRR